MNVRNLSVESNQNAESKRKSVEFRNEKNVESNISQSRVVDCRVASTQDSAIVALCVPTKC